MSAVRKKNFVRGAIAWVVRGLWDLLGPSRGWKRWLAQLALLLILAGAGGFLVAASGVMPIKASSGHWDVTAWLLQFSMRRSVATNALLIEADRSLDDPLLILKGAGHYETGCSPCHSRPGVDRLPIPLSMTPHPPPLSSEMADWSAEELFYIVKHGVKFTGMPAYPALERDDEIWAVVAFLQTLGDLSAEEYDRLVFGEETNDMDSELLGALPVPLDADVFASCVRCHGPDGQGRGEGAFPRLAGQKEMYLVNALGAYRRLERHSGLMEPVSARLTDVEIRALSEYFSALDPADEPSEHRSMPKDEVEAVGRGETIARNGIPSQGVPACMACHGPSKDEKNPNYPLLAGQYADYLELQLKLFKEEKRGHTEYSHLMTPVANRLKEDQMADVAAYYASLDPVTE